MTSFHAPCHTRGHILFYIEAKEHAEEQFYGKKDEENNDYCVYNKILFTGDTTFIGGTGRFFEGNAQEMARNVDYIMDLPNSTQIFCGHDYLKGNISFAQGIEKEHEPYESLLKKAELRSSEN